MSFIYFQFLFFFILALLVIFFFLAEADNRARLLHRRTTRTSRLQSTRSEIFRINQIITSASVYEKNRSDAAAPIGGGRPGLLYTCIRANLCARVRSVVRLSRCRSVRRYRSRSAEKYSELQPISWVIPSAESRTRKCIVVPCIHISPDIDIIFV